MQRQSRRRARRPGSRASDRRQARRRSREANRSCGRWMFLGNPGCLSAREGRDQRNLRLRGRLGQRLAEYETVSTGETGHAESVQIVYDPSQITYGELLRVFFSVAHDPDGTQSPGTGHGHAISLGRFSTETTSRSTLPKPTSHNSTRLEYFLARIVTQVVPLQGFYPAEAYHQNYAALHPESALHLFQRCSQGRALAQGVSGSLHRKVRE